MNFAYYALIYIVSGFVVMGIESRWKINIYLFAAITLQNNPEKTYKTRVKEETDHYKWSPAYALFITAIWWINLIMIISKLILFVVMRAWYFFYNGFRIYPPSEQVETMDAE